MPDKKIKSHDFYMKKALALAQKAADTDEVPIGALIIDAHGKIIARAWNTVEKNKSQIEHAELKAIAKAGKKRGDWRLQGCWLYVTLEPCAMCMNAIVLARLAGVVYGASSPLFGYQKVDKGLGDWLYKKDTLGIIGGICKEMSAQLLQQFFKKKRKESE